MNKTMAIKNAEDCLEYLDKLLKYRKYLEENMPPGYGEWRYMSAKIDMLYWFLYGE
jgi:hypothetical protein